jgi:hypothetical protein
MRGLSFGSGTVPAVPILLPNFNLVKKGYFRGDETSLPDLRYKKSVLFDAIWLADVSTIAVGSSFKMVLRDFVFI